MSFLSRLLEWRSAPAPSGGLAVALANIFNQNTTTSGEIVNEPIALQHITVYVAARVIAESVGSLTCRLFKRLPRGRQEAVDDPVWRLLALEPNAEMNASTVWESVAGAMAIAGNSYLEIIRNGTQPSGLYPLSPLQTEPIRLPDGCLAFRTHAGMTNGQSRIIKAADMLHFPLFSWDGLKGLSPIQQARQSIGLARATEKYGSRYFGNGSKPGGILTPVGQVSEEDLVNMRQAWEQANSGENQGRVAVIPSQWSYSQLALSPEDSQFLQTRNFSRSDIAALFRLSPSMVGDTTRLSNGNHEQIQLSFVTDTLRPYLVRIEREISRKLLPRDGSMFAEFDVSERLRGDFATTMQGFAVGKQWGFYNTNTVLEKLGENPIGPEGDVYWAPVNMVNAANLLATGNAQPNDQVQAIDEPTPAQRSLFSSYVPAFTSLFSDAAGRITQRSKRDVDTITPIIMPVLQSISNLVEAEARADFNLPDDWSASEKVTRDYVKALATRAADWTPETRDAVAAGELSKAIRTLHMGIYREAGATLAQRKYTDVSEAA